MEDWDRVLEQARTGDDRAWRTIIDLIGAPVLGYARARGSIDPEDILAAVLLDLLRALARFRGDPDALRAFAIKIARDRIADQQRRASSRHERHEAEPPDTADPFDHTERATQQDLLQRALASLPPLHRDVLYLRIGLGLSAVQVGRIVGKRAGTIRVIVHRALLRVRAEQSAAADGPNEPDVGQGTGGV